jgi:hypothetical protein
MAGADRRGGVEEERSTSGACRSPGTCSSAATRTGPGSPLVGPGAPTSPPFVAPGGVGKSALVWDWLRNMQGAGWPGADRVYGWSFYSQGTTERHTSADAFISAALERFGDVGPNAGSPWDKGERLARLIRKRRILLVLDGVEPLQWGPGPQEGVVKDPALATLLEKLGEENAGLCVITSRLPVREVAGFAEEKSRRLDLRTLSDGASRPRRSDRDRPRRARTSPPPRPPPRPPAFPAAPRRRLDRYHAPLASWARLPVLDPFVQHSAARDSPS